MKNESSNRTTPVKPIAKLGSDPVFEAAKKAAPVSLLLTALATGVSYVAYSGDLAVSAWPWRFGLVVMLICSLAPLHITKRVADGLRSAAKGLENDIHRITTDILLCLCRYYCNHESLAE